MAERLPTLKDIFEPQPASTEATTTQSGEVLPTTKDMGLSTPSRDYYREELARMPWHQRFLAGMGQYPVDLYMGAKQMLGRATPEDLRMHREASDPLLADTAGGLGNVAGAIMTTAPLPGSGVKAAIGWSGLEGALRPTDENGDAFDRAKNAALQGTLGGVTHGVVGAAGKGIQKLVNKSRGKWADPAKKALYEKAQREGVDLSYGDLGSRQARSVEDALEKVGFSGRPEFLEKQAGQVGDMIKRADEASTSMLEKAHPDLDQGDLLAKAIRDEYAAKKGEAKRLYDVVDQWVKVGGNQIPPVTPSGLRSQARAVVKEMGRKGFADTFKDNSAYRKVLDVLDSTQGANWLTFDQARTLRSQMGGLARQAEKKWMQGNLSPDAYAAIKGLQGGLENDLDRWALATEGAGYKVLNDAYRAANDYFKGQVLPYRTDDLLRKIVMKDIDADTLLKSAIKPDRPGLAQKVAEAGGKEGADVMKSAIISSAARRGMSDLSEAGVSPMGFAHELARLEGPSGRVFSSPELAHLDDLSDILKAARRAPNFASNPPTGQRLIPFLTGGAGLGAATGALHPSWLAALAAGMGGAKGMNTLLSSHGGVRYLGASPEVIGGLNELAGRTTKGAWPAAWQAALSGGE